MDRGLSLVEITKNYIDFHFGQMISDSTFLGDSLGELFYDLTSTWHILGLPYSLSSSELIVGFYPPTSPEHQWLVQMYFILK